MPVIAAMHCSRQEAQQIAEARRTGTMGAS